MAATKRKKKKKRERRQRRIDGRRSRITKRFHRWREFPSFIGSSLKRINGKSHSGLTGDDRGRRGSPPPPLRLSQDSRRRARRRSRNRQRGRAGFTIYIFFFLLFFVGLLINYARARKYYMSPIFSCETRSGVSGKAGIPCSLRETTTRRDGMLREITCETLIRLRLANWILRNEREFLPCRSFHIFQYRMVRFRESTTKILRKTCYTCSRILLNIYIIF